jgi:hypothetical protein
MHLMVEAPARGSWKPPGAWNGHIVKTLKHASRVQVADEMKRLRSLHPSYAKEFERLLRAAQDERGQANW